MQRILPLSDHDVTIAIGNQSQTRAITVPKRQFFATGIANITLGRDSVADENWRYGRVAGFAQGVFADGARVTASVDTRDTELRDVFRHMTRRHPDQVLRQIKDHPALQIRTGSVHHYIAQAHAVIGGNSGVLFESLIHGRPVISFAGSDYRPLTTPVANLDEIPAAHHAAKAADSEAVARFVGWYLNAYTTRIDDIDPI